MKKLSLKSESIRVLTNLSIVAGGQINTSGQNTLDWPCYTNAPCPNGPTGAAATCIMAGCLPSSRG